MSFQTPKFSSILLLGLLAFPARATRYGDVEVAPIPGESVETDHGYAAYRFRVKNDGLAAARVAVALSSRNGEGISRLRREVEVPAGAGVELTLYQPAESFYPRQGTVAVNRRVQGEALPISPLQHGQNRYYGRNGNQRRFMLTSGRLATEERDRLTDKTSSRSQWLKPSDVPAALPVAEWPTDWLSFSRWDAVAVTFDELEGMPPAVRLALADWVRAGGNLLVVRGGGQAPPPEWRGDPVPGPAGCATGRMGLGRLVFPASGQGEAEAGRFVVARAMAADNPDHATLACAPAASGQVAVRGMFLLMLAFAVLVGPVNYLLCARKNKRLWMLWTSPAIAGVFIAAVLTYALFSDGIRPWGRSVVTTLLDEKTHTAVTLGTTAWYAPMLPSDGLSFGPATEVRTVNHNDSRPWEERRSDMAMDFGAVQRLTGGWMVPRYPESFGYRKVADSRLRMTFEKDADGAYWATNGLGVEVAMLDVQGDNTRLHGGPLAPGQRVKLAAGPGPRPLAARPVPRPAPRPIPDDEDIGKEFIMPRRDAPGDGFPQVNHWRAQLAVPLFAEIPFSSFKSHDLSEIVIGRMEEPLP